jgi:nitrite reductase/ring-hydroxylating ferredoxin subunit
MNLTDALFPPDVPPRSRPSCRRAPDPASSLAGVGHRAYPWHNHPREIKEIIMADGWVRAAAKADVAEGKVLGVKVGGKDIAIYHLPGGEFRATENICTHEYALLSEGWLENGCIECPLHAAQFDVRTGKALSTPADEDIKVFEVKAEGDNLMVKV